MSLDSAWLVPFEQSASKHQKKDPAKQINSKMNTPCDRVILGNQKFLILNNLSILRLYIFELLITFKVPI
jgi:hypothetical protein